MVVVIDYRAGNLYNVGHALKALGVEFRFSGDPEVVAGAGKVILPGVGSAQAAMASLRERGLVEALRSLRVPLLGICLGLQLLYEESEEDGTDCLGLLPGTIRRFDRKQVKVPHIGWNSVELRENGGSPFFDGIPSGSYFYFVHSYYAPAGTDFTLAVTRYDVEFTSVACRDNLLGLQFHPERSGRPGLKLIENFLAS